MMDEAGEMKDRREREGNRGGGESAGGGKELERETQSETEEEREICQATKIIGLH